MAKGKRKYLRWIIIVLGLLCLLFVIVVFVLTMPSPTLDKRIAEFEAKRKIPDSENAAMIYNKLFEDYDKNQFESVYVGFNFNDPNLTRKAWTEKDNPKAAEWLKMQESTISELIKASEFEKCYFPTPFESNSFSQHVGTFTIFRNWNRMLILAANNDFGEGRFDTAIGKYCCSLKMAEHILQQPFTVDYLTGVGIEGLSLDRLNRHIVQTNLNERQLKEIYGFPIKTKDEWKSIWSELYQADKLYDEKQRENLTFLQRIQMTLDLMEINYRNTGQIFDTSEDSIHKIYLRNLIYRRGDRILIGLRRYKNRNGQWPEKLEEVEPFIEDKEVFIDPQNNSSFVYKQTENGFTLYSKGPNNIDEGGKYDLPADDWVVWPLP